MIPDDKIRQRLGTFLQKSPRPLLHCGYYQQGNTLYFDQGIEPASEPPVFEIGSISKCFTTTLLMVLAHEGALRIGDRVSRYFPQYAFSTSITLKDLASHTAGLPNNPITGRAIQLSEAHYLETFTPRHLDRFLDGLQKLKSRGRYRYSNVGMGLLGNILAKVNGTSYEVAVQQRVCQPLGMRNTHIATTAYAEHQLVAGHNARGHPVPPFVWAGMDGAGCWRSTVPDMLLFLKAGLGHAGTEWQAIIQQTAKPLAEVNRKMSVGLGWHILEHPEMGRVVFHNGMTNGQHAIAGWSASTDTAMVILTNQRPHLWHQFSPKRNLDQLALDLLEMGGSPGSAGGSPA